MLVGKGNRWACPDMSEKHKNLIIDNCIQLLTDVLWTFLKRLRSKHNDNDNDNDNANGNDNDNIAYLLSINAATHCCSKRAQTLLII